MQVERREHFYDVPDTDRMVNDSERNLSAFLRDTIQTKIPGTKVRYESVTFYFTGENAPLPVAPDFEIEYPNGKKVYVEVTTGSRGKKKREVDAMMQVPDTRYTVWDRRILRRIERRNPGVKLLERRHK